MEQFFFFHFCFHYKLVRDEGFHFVQKKSWVELCVTGRSGDLSRRGWRNDNPNGGVASKPPFSGVKSATDSVCVCVYVWVCVIAFINNQVDASLLLLLENRKSIA